MATDRFGIDDSYHDARGARHETSRETRAALTSAMGVTPESAAPPLDEPDAVRILLPGGDRAIEGGGDLVLEDGSSQPFDGALPDGLPLGYHHLYPRGGGDPRVGDSTAQRLLP